MPTKHPLVSIILPVYNGENTLKATLESLVDQTYTHFELLIGIDGTRDGSTAIAKAFHDTRIQIFEHEVNLGLAENLNYLIKQTHAQSKYIAMAEQDDVYVSERLHWQVEVMEAHPEVGLISGIAEFVGDGKPVLFPGILVNNNPFPQGEALFRYLYINQLKVVNTCMMVRKSVHLNNNLRFKNTYGNYNVDWDYVLRFALVSEVYGMPKLLVRMNRKQGNPSVTTNKTAQHKASRHLLTDFKREFLNLISTKDYREALKTHRKIELGYRSNIGIVFYGIYFWLLYLDSYFLKYIGYRYKKSLNVRKNKKNNTTKI